MPVILSPGECMRYSYPDAFYSLNYSSKNKGPLRSNVIEARNYLIGLHENCITDIRINSSSYGGNTVL
jgi:hypothetical protein